MVADAVTLQLLFLSSLALCGERGEPGSQTASLVTGAAKDPDNQGCDVDRGWLLLVRHALDPARAGGRRGSMGV